MTTTKVRKKGKLLDFSKPILLSCESYLPQGSAKIDVLDEKKRIVETRLAQLGYISRNRCLYGVDDVLRSLKESRYVQENLSQGTLFGEKEHPDKNVDMKRFMKIDDTRVCHQIKKYWWDGEFLKGIVQFIAPWGPTVWDWITEADANIGFSLRIYTPNYVEKSDENGKYVVKQYPMYPVTWDCIQGPTGYRKCRINDPDEFASKNQNYLTSGTLQNGQEDWEWTATEWFVENPQAQIKDLLESYGEESLIVQDLFNFDMKEAKIVLSADKSLVTFGTEDGREITTHVNTYLFNDMMNRKA